MLTNPSEWPTDPGFGDIFSACSPPALMAALQAKFEGNPAVEAGLWSHCTAIEALYDPGQQLRVAYALSDRPLPPQRAWPEGDLIYVRYPVRSPMSRRGSVMSINGFEVEVYRFPNDRRLRGLRKFGRHDLATSVWQQWLRRDEPDLTLDSASLRRSLLRYVPEQKWIIHLHAQCREGSAGKTDKLAIAVRSADIGQCQTIFERATALRRVRNDFDGAFRILKPVALDTNLGLLATRWAWGDSLLEMLRKHDSGQVMHSVAAGLHALHRMPVPGLETVGAADRLSSAEQCVRDLSAALPSLAKASEALLGELSSRCPEDDPTARATCHNDFHWNQFRGRPERLTVLDLERLALGDPCVDVATFIAQLSMLPHRNELNVTASEAASWSQAFLTSWQDIAGNLPDNAKLKWYSAIAQLVLARGMMRHLRSGWPELARRCVESASCSLVSGTKEVAL